MTAGKVDFKHSLDCYHANQRDFRILDVPDLQYLMIDGQGDPGASAEYTGALDVLYPLAYALKFASKRDLARDYVVPPLEGLWWSQNMDAFTTKRDKSQWHWTLMIMVPEWLGQQDCEAARRAVSDKASPRRLDDVRLESLSEGLCVQILHIGSYDDEGGTLARMHDEFIPSHGLRMTGRHHEVYLSDPRRTAMSRLRTILRQPVAEVDADA